MRQGKPAVNSSPDKLSFISRYRWWLVASAALIILIAIISSASPPTYSRDQIVDFDDQLSFMVETVVGNRPIGDLPIDVPYPNLICENNPNYVSENLIYPNWLQDSDSAQFRSHAQAYKAFDSDHNLQPGSRSNTFYCLNYYRNQNNNLEDRATYQESAELVGQYLSVNTRLSVDYRIEASETSIDLSQLKIRLISAQEDLVNKRVNQVDLHWLLRGPRSGNNLDTASELTPSQARLGSVWADIADSTDSNSVQIEIDFNGQVKLVELGDIVPPLIKIEPDIIDNQAKDSLEIKASSSSDDLDPSSWQYKLIAPNRLCGRAVMMEGTSQGASTVLNQATANGQRVCFKVADQTGNYSYRASSLIQGL